MRVRIPAEDELAPFHRAALASLVALGAAARARPQRPRCRHRRRALSGQHRRRRALERRARLSRSRARARRRCASAAMRRSSACSSARGARTVLSCGRASELHEVRAGRVIVCAGAYDSPALLLRSGIGPAGRPAGARHPGRRRPAGRRREPPRPSRARAAVLGHARADPGLSRVRRDAGRSRPIEGVIAKLRSSHCAPEGFDLHVYPVGGVVPGGVEFWIPVACMTPRSRGTVRLAGADGSLAPAARPRLLQRSRGPRSRRAARRSRAGARARAQRPVRGAARR